jgi:GH24 family phage-related lysozyme (muramidase)
MKEFFSKFTQKGLPGGPNELKAFTEGFITSSEGQWAYPGMNTLIPNAGGRITMQGVNYPVLGIDDLGNQMMMEPGEEYQFPGDSVYEIPMKKGGLVKMPKLTKKNKKYYNKKFSSSIDATSRLFTESELFKKAKSKKKKVFDPKSQYQDGGITDQEEIDAANRAIIKARLAYAHMHGNPAAQRMVVAPDQPYDFGDGNTGTHYMASMDDYAVPQIQDVNGQLMLGDYGPESAEAIRFDNPEDAMYFAENYKDVSPAFEEAELTEEEIKKYRRGGWVVEEIEEYDNGGGVNFQTYEEQLRQLENSIKAGYKGGRWYPHDSPEGGTKTIGYGHKMSGKENYSKGLTTAQVLAMQKKDLVKHKNIAKSMVDQKYGAGTFDRLPESRKVLLVDYAYNGVLHEFPNFMRAAVKGDKAGMLKEYKRYTGSKPLTQRNEWTRSVIEGSNVGTAKTNTPKTLPAKTAPKKQPVKQPVKKPIAQPKFSSNETFSYDYRPDAVYRVADSGDWYINAGKDTHNEFIKLNDPTGKRTETLRKFAHINEVPLDQILNRINNSGNYDSRIDLGYVPGQ